MGYVYFIQAEESHRIKIGYASNPLARLELLQTGSPEPLALLGFIPGDIPTEQRLHARHAQYRLHGEWFAPGIGLMTDVARLLGVSEPTPQQRASLRAAETARTSSEARLSAQASAHLSWANTRDRTARTQPARAALDRKFLDQAGGDPVRAAHLRKAYYQRLALKSAQARRSRKGV